MKVYKKERNGNKKKGTRKREGKKERERGKKRKEKTWEKMTLFRREKKILKEIRRVWKKKT